MSARAARGRRQRGVRESLASIVLATEAVVVLLAALVVFGLHDLPPVLALGGGAVLLVLIVVAAGAARWPAGIVLGWVVQVLLVASIAVNVAVGVVGIAFAALWVYCMMRSSRIERSRAA